jgi:hypothetical protein
MDVYTFLVYQHLHYFQNYDSTVGTDIFSLFDNEERNDTHRHFFLPNTDPF